MENIKTDYKGPIWKHEANHLYMRKSDW